MNCPNSIESTPVDSPKSFTNWSGNSTFTTSQSFQPSTRGEIVEIIRMAEEQSRQVKWTGSRWSYMQAYASEDIIIESEAISGEIDRNLILNNLSLTENYRNNFNNLFHIKGGTKIFNINRILHGLSPTVNSYLHNIPTDESNLVCMPNSKAMPTLGGSGGQAIAGAIATGTHGGDIRLSPIADAVVAIHLISSGGQEWWIERTAGITTGTEEDTRINLQNIANTVAGADIEICQHVMVKKDDDFFNSVLVSLGRMGFTYSLVIKTVNAYKLTENRENNIWETFFNDNLSTQGLFDSYINENRIHHLNIAIMPFSNSLGQHVCKIAKREIHEGDCGSLPNDNDSSGGGSGGFDYFGMICKTQDVRSFIPYLFVILTTLIASLYLLNTVAAALLASASASAATFFGAIIAVGLYIAAVAVYAIIAGIVVTIAALVALIGYLAFSDRLTSRELIAAVSDFAFRFGFRELMINFLSYLFDQVYPVPLTKTGFSWKIMDTYGYSDADSFCEKADSMDFAFDAFATTNHYSNFIDEVLGVFDDLRNRNIVVAGNLALRFSSNTNALLGISKFSTTCHIEIAVLRSFAGNVEFLERVQTLAKRYGAFPSWGQTMNTYNAADIAALYGNNLTTWRRTLTELIRLGEGRDFTFSNNFTLTYNLEPLNPALIRIKQLNFEIEIGRDGVRGQDFAGTSHLLGDLEYIREGRNVLEVIGFNNIGTRERENWRGWGQGIHNKIFIFSQPVVISNIERLGIYMPAAGGAASDNADIERVIVTAVSIDDLVCTIGRSDRSFRLTGNNQRVEIQFNGCMP